MRCWQHANDVEINAPDEFTVGTWLGRLEVESPQLLYDTFVDDIALGGARKHFVGDRALPGGGDPGQGDQSGIPDADRAFTIADDIGQTGGFVNFGYGGISRGESRPASNVPLGSVAKKGVYG